ncbi:four-helix bundle copper-binding protein [Roseomonas sp. NAR14]|jgi:hypothetical protein|uniref:Four-helix bundle copper-binding protein n=2 Tax=Roseomonas TaxID=125216 RepID=A0A9X2BX68_9PROT|nr:MULTISPECIES: four-helix bundle copper-binding protein [Roseomonas]MCK8786881.1 four-helix bundle copper-binding protein [Roseomonas acroporae]UFN51817.1 four-helix bundle copper-binding protein [Roseomonas sp. OT10]
MHHMSTEMQACIEECLRCHSTCLSMAMNHCLEVGGQHVEPAHFKLMMACAEICQTSANMMLIGTHHHKHTCRECAEICEECAASCDAVGGMEACAEQCRKCAASCRAMAA